MTDVERFFVRYEEGANSFDPDLVVSEFADCFLAADPNGATCVENDAAFRAAIPERQKFFQEIGFQFARVLSVAETKLDDRYTLAKVHWHLSFDKEDLPPADFKFYITYVLFGTGANLKIVFYVAHDDERRVLREAGFLADD